MKSFSYAIISLCLIMLILPTLYLGAANNAMLAAILASFALLGVAALLANIGEQRFIEECIGRRLYKGKAR